MNEDRPVKVYVGRGSRALCTTIVARMCRVCMCVRAFVVAVLALYVRSMRLDDGPVARFGRARACFDAPMVPAWSILRGRAR